MFDDWENIYMRGANFMRMGFWGFGNISSINYKLV